MKRKLRDRWNDRGPVDDPVAELDRLAARLRDVETQLAFSEEQVAAAEEAERELQGAAEKLFANVLAPDEFDRRRAEVAHSLTSARRVRDDLKEVVAAGRRACEVQHASICEQQKALCDEQKDLLDRDLAEAIDRVRSLEALEVLIAERRRSFDYYEKQWLALKARYDGSGKPKTQPQLPAETPERSRARQVADVLATRIRDPDGNERPAYSRIPTDGRPVRLS